MVLLLDCIFVFMELIGFLIVANVYFEKRFHGKKVMIIAIIGGIIFFEMLGLFFNFVGTTTIKSVLAIFNFFFFLQLFYQGEKLKKLFLVAMYYILLYAVDYLGMAGSLLILNTDIGTLYNSKLAYIIVALLSKIMLIYSCIIFSKIVENRRKDEKFSVLKWGQILVVPICMILNLTVVVYDLIKNNEITFVLFLDIVLLLAGTFIYAYLETELEKKKQIEISNLILTQQIQAEEKQAELVRNHLQEQRKLTHDFQNHLYTLQELLKNPKHTEEARAYIGQLTEKSEEKMQAVYTKNPIIDALLNQKYNVCKREQIPVFFELNDLHTFDIKQEKIVVILSNILDNAIEACRKQEMGRYIKVKFLSDNLETILSIQNATNGEKQSHFEQFVSTKEDRLLHGYGLKNALQAVEDSGGTGEIACGNGIFQFTAVWN